ncbi:MAG: serine hydrolase [Spirochaetota bacterium]
MRLGSLLFIFFLSHAALFSKSYQTKAKAILVQDFYKHNFIISKSTKKLLPIASITKLVTALTAIEHSPLKKEIRISANSIVKNTYESKAGLRKGEIYQLKDLLYALLVPSGNDAANAIALGISGTKKSFVRQMNLWKGKHKLLQTHFQDPVGLSNRNYSSAKDLAHLVVLVEKNTILRKILQKKRHRILSKKKRKLWLKTRNKLRSYKGFTIYGKTGSSRAAKKCFAGIITNHKKKYIIVILGSKNIFQEIKNTIRYLKVTK